jgi:hypothetical protein
VLGSSLRVYSGYRFVRRAAEHGIPVAIITRGPSRGDAAATVRLDASLGHVLPALADALRLCLLYARSDPGPFDRAIVRWHGRLCLDAGGLDTPTA